MMKVAETFNSSKTLLNFSSTIEIKLGKVSEILKVSATFIIVDFVILYPVNFLLTFFYGLRISTMMKVVETFNISETLQISIRYIGIKVCKVSDILKESKTFIIVDFARLYLVI